MTNQQNEGVAAEQASMLNPVREKYWEECTDAEKIDRLREYVARQEQAIALLAANLQNLLRHSHGADGRLLMPLTEAGSNQATIGGSGYMSYGVTERIKTKRERENRW